MTAVSPCRCKRHWDAIVRIDNRIAIVQNKSWVSLAGLTFAYSVALAAIMQAAHTLTRVLLSLGAVAAFTNPGTILGELVSKIAWAVFACEAVVLLSILARRRWLLIVIAAGVSIFLGAVLGAYLRSVLEMLLGRVSVFVWQLAFDSSMLLGAKYVLVGAAVAWANRVADSTLRHYLAAGLIAAIGASAITWVAMSADFIAKLGTVAIDFVFPLGCSAVVWKVRQIAEPMIERQREMKAALKKI